MEAVSTTFGDPKIHRNWGTLEDSVWEDWGSPEGTLGKIRGTTPQNRILLQTLGWSRLQPLISGHVNSPAQKGAMIAELPGKYPVNSAIMTPFWAGEFT